MSLDPLEQIQTEYRSGKITFERGRYRQSIEHLETACDLVDKNSRLGGEIQIWLATAYQALGKTPNAIALCKQLSRHPSWETRKQSRRLLEILEAPELKSNLEGLIQIPDMTGIDESSRSTKDLLTRSATPLKRSTPKSSSPETVDLTQVNTKDNGFLSMALILIAALIGGLFFFY